MASTSEFTGLFLCSEFELRKLRREAVALYEKTGAAFFIEMIADIDNNLLRRENNENHRRNPPR